MKSFQGQLGLALLLLAPLTATACSLVPSGGKANLAPTLSLRDEPGGVVAFQSGQPVPTFDRQPRLQADLDGAWRFEPATLETGLTLTDRSDSLKQLTTEVGPRAGVLYDDSQWSSVDVPGTFNPPLHRETTGGYYRRTFYVPAVWSGKYALLKFGAVRYVADVWMNGEYLGYHEGGDTPFAMDATEALIPGGFNSVVVRVDNPEWGTRDDIVPWGLADWWNYGGIAGDVWLEAMPPLSVVRADVTPHLDGADVSIVVEHRGGGSTAGVLDVRLWPAQVNDRNRLSPDARGLIPPDAEPLLEHQIDVGTVGGDSVFRIGAPFSIRPADLWSPGSPALYVLQVTVLEDGQPVDDLYTSFGLRQVRVDSNAPRILLNGQPVVFNGVAMHEEKQLPVKAGKPAGGPLTSPLDIDAILQRAVALHADLVRVDHHPPNWMLPVLADRLGIALWEEIPLYHYTPQTFSIATDRGIPQQMLAEMALRDFNRPSVLFHGFANESTGALERTSLLEKLHALDRKLDGTRLTGQAAYGTEPADPTSANLDVAGYTIYYGVLYGGRLSGAVLQKALSDAHRTYPKKPIMVLEYGHWADNAADEAQQARVFNTYYSQLEPNFDTQPGGFIGAAVWWTLDDYWTQRPGLAVETFGLYSPSGALRKAGVAAGHAWARTAPSTSQGPVRSSGVAIAIQPSERHSRLPLYIAYSFALPALGADLAHIRSLSHKAAAGMVSDFLVRLSIRSAMFAGAITGFVFGLFAGGTLGAIVSWFAGAIVDWQSQLGFSLGVTQQLLPLGDQVESLGTIADRWFLVIPAVGLLAGVLGALIGLLAGGLWAALVNMGVLPIQVTVVRRDVTTTPMRRATDRRHVRTRNRRKAVGE